MSKRVRKTGNPEDSSQKYKIRRDKLSQYQITYPGLKQRYRDRGLTLKLTPDQFSDITAPSRVGVTWITFKQYVESIAEVYPDFGREKFSNIVENPGRLNVDNDRQILKAEYVISPQHDALTTLEINQSKPLHTNSNPPLLASSNSDLTSLSRAYLNILARSIISADQLSQDFAFRDLNAEIQDFYGRLTPVQNVCTYLSNRIKKRTERYLVVADAGAGKSVMLRQLALRLCESWQPGWRLPVLVDLREFSAGRYFTSDRLLAFVIEQLKQRFPPVAPDLANRLLPEYIGKGKICLLLDSVDELPASLDCNSSSSTHRAIEDELRKFLDLSFASCSWIIATRPSRFLNRLDASTLFLSKLSDSDARKLITKRLHRSGVDQSRILQRLYRDSPYIIKNLGNPLYTNIIASFLRTQPAGNPPDSRSQLFEHYLKNKLRLCHNSEELGMGDRHKGLWDVAAFLAWKAFEQPSTSLVVSLTSLEAFNHGPELNDAVDLLVQAGVIQRSGTSSILFSHRQFAEYLSSYHLNSLPKQEQGRIVDEWLMSTYTDSRWRECLLFYMEQAENEFVKEIRAFCSQHLEREVARYDASHQASALIYLLRFLSDCPSRLEQSEVPKLAQSVIRKLIVDNDLIMARLASQCLNLSAGHKLARLIRLGLNHKSAWVREGALSSLHLLERLSKPTERAIRREIARLPTTEKYLKADTLLFQLGLRSSLKNLKQVLKIDLLEPPLLALSCIFNITLSIFLSPFSWLVSVIGSALLAAFFLAYARVLGYRMLLTSTRPKVFWNRFLQRIGVRNGWSQTIDSLRTAEARHLLRRFSLDQEHAFAVIRSAAIASSLVMLWSLSIELERQIDVAAGVLNAATHDPPRAILTAVLIAGACTAVLVAALGSNSLVDWYSSMRLSWRTSRAGRLSVYLMLFCLVLFLGFVSLSPEIHPKPPNWFLPAIIGLVFFSLLLTALIFLYALVQIPVSLIRTASELQDLRSAQSIGWRSPMSVESVFDNLARLKTNKGRVYYLSMIRKSRVELVGDILLAPEWVQGTPELKDELYKIKSYWDTAD